MEPWPNALSDWESAKNSGNSLYGQSKYDEALEQYVRAITFLELETSEEGLCLLHDSCEICVNDV